MGEDHGPLSDTGYEGEFKRLASSYMTYYIDTNGQICMAQSYPSELMVQEDFEGLSLLGDLTGEDGNVIGYLYKRV